jgi:predicted lipid-binding transport protein (Tim44 family)
MVSLACSSFDQVVGHGPAQRTAARQDRDVRGVLGQVQGGLAGGVAGADHEHLAAGHRRASLTTAP